ncbi:MAG: DUF2723 domain-containing protein [Chitinispirillaceae bacterium]|nr:DUF2723 domain-containing protein [Chitinispirillaceae bacterium]
MPYPVHNPAAVAGVACLSFLINFLFYLLTLAPTVTFEDSGELITAAFHLGIPHEPGYPLFTLLGRIFSMLPFGTIAWRVNFMSALFTAGAGVFVCWATILLIEETFSKSLFLRKSPAAGQWCLYSVGICSAILFGTAKTTWAQAIIAEVYGINSFMVGLFIFLALYRRRQQDLVHQRNLLLLMGYVAGLACAAHTTSMMLAPLFAGYLLIYERKMLADWRLLVKLMFLFILGLSLYLYLPAASLKNPVVDWGDPDNLTNFIRVITRHQYQYGTRQTFETFSAQFGFFCFRLLVNQWFPVVLTLVPVGLAVLFLRNRPAGYFTSALLLFTMPLTTFMTNFDISNPVATEENGALVSVFYIPGYLTAAILIGVGLFWPATLIGTKNRFFSLLLCLCMPLASIAQAMVRAMPEVSMHGYTFARDYCDNVATAIPENALYFVSWDPFCFPLIYYQFVEKKRTDLIVIDQQLLRRSWYIHWLQRHYPGFTRQAAGEIKAFLAALAPFEAGKHYDGNYIQACYIGMINAMIDAKLQAGNGVYFAYTPEPSIMRSYRLEPQFVAYKYTRDPIDRKITDAGLKFSMFTDSTVFRDRMAEYIRNYYGNLYGLRGLQFGSIGEHDKALDCLRKSYPFFNRGTKQALFVQQKMMER